MRPQDPFIGRDILDGQFQILQKIGSGGMGVGLQGAPAGDEPDGGGQDPPPEARQPQGPRLALPPRGAGDEPPHAPEHGEGVPLRRARRRLALHRHGVPRGQEPEPDGARRGAVPGRARAPDPHPGVRRARRGAPARASSTAISSPRTSSSASRAACKDYPKVLDFGLAKVDRARDAPRARSSSRKRAWSSARRSS